MPIDHASLQHLLEQTLPVRRLWVAYSGGVDSHVLLHWLHAQQADLPPIAGAVHVHHGISSHADDWAGHCRRICDDMGLHCEVRHVDAIAASGESPEQAAREARYRAFAEVIGPGDALLLAQHQDDQAETFLLQALRGAGPQGLASMPACRAFQQGWLLRPLLNVGRRQILDYALTHGLQWIEDDSNTDQGLDRNYLRHIVMPLLRQRWPSMAATLSRAAGHCAEQVQLLTEVAGDDLQAIAGLGAGTLSVQRLRQLAPAHAAHLLRLWITRAGLSLPSTAQLTQLLQTQLDAAADRRPVVGWSGGEIRRYRDDLYVMAPLPAISADDWCYEWRLDVPLSIVELHGRLSVRRTRGDGIAAGYADQSMQVRPRRGGERCRPPHRRHSQLLKVLFQEQGIPPWQRERLPLVWRDGELVAVGDLWVCEGFQARPGEPALRLEWQPL